VDNVAQSPESHRPAIGILFQREPRAMFDDPLVAMVAALDYYSMHNKNQLSNGRDLQKCQCKPDEPIAKKNRPLREVN